MAKAIRILILIFVWVKYSQANDFPSLLVANATVGVIIDHEYLGEEYEKTFEKMKEIIERVIREDLKGAGLNIKYYSWSKINFNKDFTAIFSIASCTSTWEIFEHVQRERLLLMAITDPDCPRLPLHEALTIPRIKIGVELPQIILDIRTSHLVNWKTATILYDDIFDRDTISRVANALSVESASLAMSISLLKLNSSTDVYERRENIKKSLLSFPIRNVGSNFLVIATIPMTIIEVATEMNMINTGSQWMFLISNPRKTNVSQLMTYVKEGGNVAIASNNTIINGSCSMGEDCLYHELFKNFAMSLSKLVREEEAIYSQISDEEWESIRLSKRERRDSMLEFIKERLREEQLCKPCVNWKFESIETWGLRFDMSESGKLKPFKPVSTYTAVWEPTNGFIHYDKIYPHIAHGFRNRSVPIAIYHNPPWQIVSYNDAGQVTGMRGVTVNILKELADKLNFTYLVHNVERNVNRSGYSFWDDFNVTADDDIKSTFNLPVDILELVTDNMVLFGAVGLTVHETYEKMINYTYPISVQAYGMMIPRPKELSRLYLFLSPFTLETWLCLSFTIALIGPLFYAVHYLSPYHEHHQITKKGGLFKVQNCFWYMYGALLQQGGMYLPRSDSGRIIVGTWWMVVLVVVAIYCGNLVAFLTFPKMEISVNSISQLVKSQEQGGFTWSIRSNTFLESFLKETDIEKYVKLNESTENHEIVSKSTISRVRSGKHIIIDWETNLLHIMRKEYLETDKCEFTLSNEKFLDEKIGLILPANSPYLNIINDEIYRMLQMGFINRWLSEYLPKKDRCTSKISSMEIENHTVNLADMQGCFLVLIAGIIAAIFIIMIECCCRRYRVLDDKKLIKPFVK
ncbi:ionotropic receptor 93a isoform X2 [Contarinia nasturtii]|uniref:ionotropic receptor 93a isoform X2 n=1 Tax=Contarinia nasturtii TaxID=265458 RepID=UPI0012D3CD01|nr:ionotropic receptor 93a isoform X2 [Contarinia nasturtii]